jgi:hypothetical protein
VAKPNPITFNYGQLILQHARKRYHIIKLKQNSLGFKMDIKNYDSRPGWWYSPHPKLRPSYAVKDLPIHLKTELNKVMGIQGSIITKEKIIDLEGEIYGLKGISKTCFEDENCRKRLCPPKDVSKCNLFVYDSLYAAGFEVPLDINKSSGRIRSIIYLGPKDSKPDNANQLKYFDPVIDPQDVIQGDVVLFLGSSWNPKHIAIVSEIIYKPITVAGKITVRKESFKIIDQHGTNRTIKRIFNNLERGTYFMRPKKRR